MKVGDIIPKVALEGKCSFCGESGVTAGQKYLCGFKGQWQISVFGNVYGDMVDIEVLSICKNYKNEINITVSKTKKCDCDFSIIMAKGCQCGGI